LLVIVACFCIVFPRIPYFNTSSLLMLARGRRATSYCESRWLTACKSAWRLYQAEHSHDPAHSLYAAALSSVSSTGISTQSTLGNRSGHLLGSHRPRIPRFDHTAWHRSGAFRQQDYTAIAMDEEFHPIARLQPKMFTDRFRDGGLALDGDRRFISPPLHIS
jgi:hypothetical protein